MKPYYSIVIPLYNEQEVFSKLLQRLIPAADNLPNSYEIVFVNDGSKDATLQELIKAQNSYPDKIRVVDLACNVGQYQAIVAGLAYTEGTYVFIMDADLQNHPEDMQRLLPALKNGADYVGSFREDRNDKLYRDAGSRLNNWLRHKITGISMKDHGCMLRVFHRDVVDSIVSRNAASPFLTLEAYKFSRNYHEVGVRHSERADGESKYGLVDLLKIHFDWMTHFTQLPLLLPLYLGTFFMFLSLIGVCIAIIEKSLTYGFLSFLGIIGSCTLVSLGFFGTYLGRIHKSVIIDNPYTVRKFYTEKTKPTSAHQTN